MEEKNWRDRFSQVALLGLPVSFFLQHSSIDSLQALLLPVEAAERNTIKAPAKTTASIAIRMVCLLLMIVDLFHLTTIFRQMLQLR